MLRTLSLSVVFVVSLSVSANAMIVIEDFEISSAGLLNDRLEVGDDLTGGGGPFTVAAPPFDSQGFRYAYVEATDPAAIIDSPSSLNLVGQTPDSDYIGFSPDFNGRLSITRIDGSSFRLVSFDFGPTLEAGQVLDPNDNVSLLVDYETVGGTVNSTGTFETSSMATVTATFLGIGGLDLVSMSLRQSNSTPFVGIDNATFSIAAVPEPSSTAVALTAFSVVFFSRRRKAPSAIGLRTNNE